MLINPLTHNLAPYLISMPESTNQSPLTMPAAAGLFADISAANIHLLLRRGNLGLEAEEERRPGLDF